MKRQTKIKQQKIKTNWLQKINRQQIALAFSKRSKLRHFGFVHSRHSWKIIHHRHTSHLALMIILLIVGIFLLFGNYFASAVNVSGTVTIGAVVNGPPPSIGAVITYPKNNLELIKTYSIKVSGTCQIGTYVVVTNNGVPVGLTNCTSEGLFSVDVQLFLGNNVLKARNYDNLNQAGPETATVLVIVKLKDKTPVINPPDVPVTPENPTIIPDDDCDKYQTGKLPKSDQPYIAIVCVPRLFLPNTIQKMGLIVWGGNPPYALSIDLGDGSDPKLLSIVEPGYQTVSLSYTTPNIYKVSIKLIDSKGLTAAVSASVQVSGIIIIPQIILSEDIFDSPWFKTPVPLYMLAVAVTIGFWLGDIFDKKFGLSNKKRRRRLSAKG